LRRLRLALAPEASAAEMGEAMRIGFLKLFEPPRYIGGKDDPLIVRWVLFRVPWFGIFLHKFCRSDHDRALHDHPWPFVSVILRGGYSEVCEACPACRREQNPCHLETETKQYRPGSILFRPATWRHRVEILAKPSWNLIFVGPRRRKWGFWPGGKFCWWRKYNYQTALCEEEILWEDGDD
jgi:hypothetical protein